MATLGVSIAGRRGGAYPARGMHDAELAIAVVQDGAEAVRRRFGTELDRVEKGAGDFATSDDIEAEAGMLGVISRHRPGDAILAEESGRSGPSDSSRAWLIDPLCGTANYAARMAVVAVNAALSDSGRVRVAAVGDPFTAEVFWTDGVSAFVRRGSRDEPLVPSAVSRLVDLNFDPPFPNAPAFRTVTLAAEEEFIASFRPRVVSSSLALAWVATGQRAAYITDGNVRDSVHFAAGVALCEAAGCTISDLHGDPSGRAGLIAAADRHTHAEILRLARKHL